MVIFKSFVGANKYDNIPSTAYQWCKIDILTYKYISMKYFIKNTSYTIISF